MFTRATQINANASTVKYTQHLSILHPYMAKEYPVFHCAFLFAFALSQFTRPEMQTQLALRQVYAPTQKLGA